LTKRRAVRNVRRPARLSSAGETAPEGDLDVVDHGLDAFEVFGVDLEDQVLGAEQESCLEDELEALALPVLKRAGEELVKITASWNTPCGQRHPDAEKRCHKNQAHQVVPADGPRQPRLLGRCTDAVAERNGVRDRADQR
jgi:hypothetical protein